MFSELERMYFPFDENNIPENGIYILFEKAEYGHGTDRIVRVGTHTGKNQLRSRLKQHFINENKDRSIFRKNIGRTFLNMDNDTFIDQWELDLTTRENKEKYFNIIDFNKQEKTEKRVSKYIQDNFSFVVFEVSDKDKRIELESKLISTISLCTECKSTETWFGKNSPKKKIRESGLWLVNNLYKTPLSDNEIGQLELILHE
ncbi:hypothetical protein V7O61_08740 [Methanolobus sp. WCC1]|uniref:hypothetical protein n=1 Tax=unclassified Methanolobus TaxID=2629569 RepID=UPI003244222A